MSGDELPLVFCAVCNHHLNNSLYKVCEHPQLGLAICILCLHELDTVSFHPKDDLCVCCCDTDDTGELFMCNDCDYSYCRDCLKANLSPINFEVAINIDDWKCLACDPSQIAHMIRDAKTLAESSIYSDSFREEDNEALVEGEQLSREQLLEVNIARLALLQKELDSIKDENLTQKQHDISEELALPFDSPEVKDELNHYLSLCQKHIDIIQAQELDLLDEEGVGDYGLRSYKIPSSEEAKSPPIVDFAQRDQLLKELSEEDDEDWMDLGEEVREFHAYPKEDIKSAEQLEALRDQAESDIIVQRIIENKDPLPHSAYPYIFRRIAPAPVLLALSHAMYAPMIFQAYSIN